MIPCINSTVKNNVLINLPSLPPPPPSMLVSFHYPNIGSSFLYVEVQGLGQSTESISSPSFKYDARVTSTAAGCLCLSVRPSGIRRIAEAPSWRVCPWGGQKPGNITVDSERETVSGILKRILLSFLLTLSCAVPGLARDSGYNS